MILAKCDFCGNYIEQKRQFVLVIESCDNGTSQNPNGSENQKQEEWDDLCKKCFDEIMNLKVLRQNKNKTGRKK